MEYFKDMDFTGFWDEDDTDYISAPPTDELIAQVEEELGYKLPGSYIELMKLQNGGSPLRMCYPCENYSEGINEIDILWFLGIGYENDYSLLGEYGNKHLQDDCGLPKWGVCIGDVMGGNDTTLMLDYRTCGKEGEPEVVLVKPEEDCLVIPLAKNFELFIKGLMNSEELIDWEIAEDERKEQEADLKKLEELGELKYFKGMDFTGFWDNDDYSKENYLSEPATNELIAKVEEELGYKLPGSYIELMKWHNGGMPLRNCYPAEDSSWSESYIMITGIMGMGSEKRYSLLGELGSKFMQEEWGYPEWGICLCDTPTAGHTMVMLDYRECGKKGEPEVVFVDQESDFETTFVAKDFETFIRGLITEEEAEELEETAEQKKRTKLAEGEPEGFMDKLDYWHDTMQFQKIVDTIIEIPEKGRKFIETRRLGSALNNLGQYEEALKVLKSVEEEGINSAGWNYIIGYSYYHLDQFKMALTYFERADALEPNDEDTLDFIEYCKEELEESEE